jgi:Fe-S-cluster-containing hydrogenase component 2
MPWVDNKKCIGCGRCVQICPKQAISMDKDNKAHIDQKLCNKCGRCILECPVRATKPYSENPSLVGRIRRVFKVSFYNDQQR